MVGKSTLGNSTIGKFLSGISLAAFLFSGISATAHPISPPSHRAQQDAQTTAVSGKVVAIASDKRAISLEVADNGDNKTMQFVVDDNTHITGHVNVGTTATVQYEATDDGKLVARNIVPKPQ